MQALCVVLFPPPSRLVGTILKETTVFKLVEHQMENTGNEAIN